MTFADALQPTVSGLPAIQSLKQRSKAYQEERIQITVFNNTIRTFKLVLDIAVEAGALILWNFWHTTDAENVKPHALMFGTAILKKVKFQYWAILPPAQRTGKFAVSP